MNYTTIEQSKKLLEASLDPESADMFWKKDQNCIGIKAYNLNTTIRYTKKELSELFAKDKDIIPCWSVGALLELMPKKIEEVRDHTIELIFGKPKDKWSIMYFDWTGLQHGHEALGDTQIDACYNMIIWLLENNYIEKKKKEE